MPHVYKIRDWDLHFENAQSRKVGALEWVRIPVKHDGLGFRRLMGMTGGVELYGAWVLIVQVAAKCPVRGFLADERGPLTQEALSLKTGCPESLFERALKVLSASDIGWLQAVDYQHATSWDPLEEKRGEENKKRGEESGAAGAARPPALENWVLWWNQLHADGLVANAVKLDPIGATVLKAWNDAHKVAALREVLKERHKIAEAIKRSEFCREGWFTLSKLLAGKNRQHEFIVAKLLEGAYRNAEPKQKERHKVDLANTDLT